MTVSALPISRYIAHLRGLGIKSATVLGKGPTLDYYQPTNGDYVMGCNDTSRWFRCDAAIYVDHLFNEFAFPENVTLLRPFDRSRSHGGRGYAWNIWQPGNPETDDYLKVTGPGTGTKALQILGMAGITDVMLWGFEGTWAAGLAKKLNGESPNPQAGVNYANIGGAMLKVASDPASSIRRVRHGVPPETLMLVGDDDG